MKYLLPLVAIVGILAIAPQARADFAGKIISVGDGDTLAVQSPSGKVTIRLACIDAPERAQAPMGAASTQYLKSLVPVNSNVRIREIENDKYGRKVAEVFSGTDSINLRMVKAGHAAVYRQYLSGCNQTKQQFLDAENSAKKSRLGIWGQSCMTMPWDFRRGKNTCLIQSNSPKSGYIAGSCKSLKAQGLGPFYKSRGDANYTTARDRDGDGIACE
jgi:micrococcal nuclease